MAEADDCQDISICSREAPPETEIDDPSIGIIPEIESGPVLAEPPAVTGPLTQCRVELFQRYNFRLLDNIPAAAPAAPGAAPNAPQYAVKAVELQTYARSAIEHIIQARNSGVDNARIADTYHLCGEVIKFAVAVGEAVTAVTSASEPVAVALTAAAAAATGVVNRASTTFKPFSDYAVANPSVGEATVNGGIEAVRIEATPSLGGVVSPADAAIDIAKQNNNPDYYYAASAASAAVAAVAIIAGNSDLYNIYYERAESAFNTGTNPVTNSDDVLSRTVDDPTDDGATTGTDPLTYCFRIMDFIEQYIKRTLLTKYDEIFNGLHRALSTTVPNLPDGGYKGFVGITRCGFLSKYTTVIYYAGYIPYQNRLLIEQYMQTCYSEINPIVDRWPVTGNFKLTCKLEKSNLQYDTQKIILCISCGTSHNIIQIPILNVVGFPVFHAVNPLLEILWQLPCFFDQSTTQYLSLLDIIVRVILCAKQGAITALSEPSKEEVTLILSCFQGLMPQGVLPALMSGNMDASAAAADAIVVPISAITEGIRTALYTDANIKPFSLFCNIFYNFINVSLGFRSLAKIIYSDFFGTSDNYGKVIRACRHINGLPIMINHVKCILTGSNAARVYLALNQIIKGADIQHTLSKTFGNLSDNDFMIYLKTYDSEPYKVFIRMILGGSFYFFKDLFDDDMLARFTEMMIQSVGIVGFMDHLFAQRFDARTACLLRCYGKDPTSFLAKMLGHMAYFDNLDKQINVAHFDGVFKDYNLVRFYAIMLNIFGIGPLTDQQLATMNVFLINKATSIDSIATVWTLVLNVLYTLFVPQNCLARIAVGKFDNDPKNLKLYMEILNDHLLELQTLGYTHRDIPELLGLQARIVGTCQTSIITGARLQHDFKQACDAWVKKMVEMAVSGPAGQGLFMLSVSDAREIGRPSTKLEHALCLAYLPTAQGNICSAASSPEGLAKFVIEIRKVMAGASLDKTPNITDVNEMALYPRLNQIGLQIEQCYTVAPALSEPMNQLWKHITTSAIDLKIFFKENLTDIKRVTGIRYIALVLGGYFQIRLLVDEVHDQCREDKRAELRSFKTSQEMMDCKRGLLPLLIQEPLLTLIRNIFQLDGGGDIPKLLKILGFLFSIKVKSSSPHSPYQLLRLEDSMSRFKQDYDALYPQALQQARILNPPDIQARQTQNPEAYNKAYEQSVRQAYQVAYTQAYQAAADRAYEFYYHQAFQESGGNVEHATAAAAASANTAATAAATVAANTAAAAPDAIADANLHAAAHVTALETLSIGGQILNPRGGSFYEFLRVIGFDVMNRAIMKCICRAKPDVARIDRETFQELWSSGFEGLYTAMGGGNDSESNSGRKSVSSLNNNKHKYKHNKLVRNNCTHRNKNKRKKNSKSKSHKPKPNSKPKSKSKSKSKSGKSRRKNVTFKRRKRSNRY